MKKCKYKNTEIWKYLNIHEENMKNVKECIKKLKSTYMKNYKVTSNRNVNKETNKQNKE